MNLEERLNLMWQIGSAYAGKNEYPADKRSPQEADKDVVVYFGELTEEFFKEYQGDVVGLLTNREGDFMDLTEEEQTATRFLQDFTFAQAWERYSPKTQGQMRVMEESLKGIEQKTDQQAFPVGGWGKGPLKRIADTLAPTLVAYIVTYNHDRQGLAHLTHGLFEKMRNEYHPRLV